MTPPPTAAEIRAAQERNVADIERQLRERADPVYVFGRACHREPAWAATRAIRKAWELDGRYDGQQLEGDGQWYARILIPIGRYPDDDEEPR